MLTWSMHVLADRSPVIVTQAQMQYTLNFEAVTFDQASAECSAQDGNLASISSADELQLLVQVSQMCEPWQLVQCKCEDTSVVSC